MRSSLLLLICALLVACVDPSHDAITPIRNSDTIQKVAELNSKPFIEYPTPEHYSICYQHTCAKFATIQLSGPQWQSIEAIFFPRAMTSQQERNAIQQAIALLEYYSGEQAGTQGDLAENDLSQGIGGQLDCIDEATNSTVYLRLLANAGLLQFHQQASRTHRGGLVAPHNTATIIETSTNIRYAVDSWFYANGEHAVIIPLPQWKKGWIPNRETIEK